jgi:predicted DNA binding CopG/RHH family protein
MSTLLSKTRPATRRKQVNIRVSDATLALLKAVRVQDGVPYSAQIERAMKMYAASKGIAMPTPNGGEQP